MKRWVVTLAWLLAGVSACDAHQQPAAGLPHAGVMASLKRTLIGAGKFDGAPITGVEQVSACSTAFITDKGRTVVDWTTIQNPAARTEAGADLLPLVGGAAAHSLSAPLTPEAAGRRMEASVGLLYADCKAKP